MKLQLALDRLTRESCFSLMKKVESHIDWIEIGTGVIKEYGMDIVREMKAVYPEKTIVADMKTCDAAEHETRQALDAGADITTVMAFSADASITSAIEEAEKLNKKVMVDLLGVTDSTRLKQLDTLGVDLVSLHIGKDMQKDKGISGSHFEKVQEFTHWQVAVAGGINEKTIPDMLPHEPDVFIVGGAITGADDPEQAAANMKRLVTE
ncbi:Fe-S cluster assembly protein HesB [Salibacterium salarium]|uniref:3-hexulose-6-phosphate synthase n=1 Tax=Salibacterium salarium TaxID=284579 RepID=A0A3R9QGW9_9BACI|nr:3-hexulose-6-phosphate synthase [Salibacterium salarium]RSL30285.1 Fe-S cluster assembly protein HesB [Salibacterium salarium]